MIRPRACYDEREREEPGMGAARKYAVIDPANGKLDRRIFSDRAVYDDEMEKIFGRELYQDSSCHRMGGGCAQLARSRSYSELEARSYPIPG